MTGSSWPYGLTPSNNQFLLAPAVRPRPSGTCALRSRRLRKRSGDAQCWRFTGEDLDPDGASDDMGSTKLPRL
jgi:hypothetical protein